MKFETKLIHGGQSEDQATGAVSIPVYRSSTFHQYELGGNPKWEYSRTGNPTRAALEALIADLAAVENAIQDNTVAIYFETPTNPLLQIADIAAITKIAKKHKLKTIVDNTFATPYNQRPLELGADIVVHSATKYLGGHSDVVAGLAVTSDEKIAEKLAFLQNSIGSTLGPDDSWLIQRGIKTLGARMRVHHANTEAIIKFLENDDRVARILYPGLPDFSGYEVAKKQMDHFGAMISFELQEGLDTKKFVESLKVISLAESLGGIESLIEVPSVMTHGSIPREIRLENGIKDELIRLSVGIEDEEDLINDLKQALDKIG